MKSLSTVILLASLAINAAFAVLLVRLPVAAPVATPLSSSAPIQSFSESQKTPREVWPALNSEDPATFTARLRASGFPPDIVRALLAAQISESFNARRKALTSDSSNAAFWKNQNDDPKVQAALRQISKEQQNLLREILGPDADSGPNPAPLDQNNLSFLTPDKASAVSAVAREFNERRSDIYSQPGGMTSDLVKSIAKEEHDRIAQLLTSEELLEYDLRNSNTARTLRNNLDVFQPSEAEFRAIYQLRAPFEERFNNQDIVAMVSAGNERMEAQEQLTEQIKATLGPKRAADYERMTNSNYRRTSQLVARLELPPATTDQLWAVQKEFEQRRSSGMTGVPVAERQQRLAALQQEAVARLTPLLGSARNVEAYQQYGGQWLQNLVPRPAPATAPRPPAGN